MSAPAEASPLSVLLAESDPIMLNVLAAFFAEEGHSVARAPSGGEALRLFQEKAHDLVLITRSMPDMDGESLARVIRALSPRTATVLMTGLLSKAGSDALDVVLHKPFSVETLREAMAAALAACAARSSSGGEV